MKLRQGKPFQDFIVQLGVDLKAAMEAATKKGITYEAPDHIDFQVELVAIDGINAIKRLDKSSGGETVTTVAQLKDLTQQSGETAEIRNNNGGQGSETTYIYEDDNTSTS